jgi:hypothetical protein
MRAYSERMLRRRLLAAAPLLLVAGAAGAAGPAKPVGQYVDLLPVGMPVVVNGQLVNYVFVYVRINLTGGADVARLRNKEPFFRDALVRAGHRTPFTLATNYQRIDEPRLSATLMREAVAIAGPDAIRSVVVTSQTPQRGVRAPNPSASVRR